MSGTRHPASSPRTIVLTTFYAPVLGGVETHARDFARFLQRRGMPVLVLTSRVPGQPSADVIDGVPVRRIGPAGPRTGATKWRMLPFALAALVRSRHEYDVIYCPDPRGLGIAAVAAGKAFRKRVTFEAATPGTISCANWSDALRRVGVAPSGTLAEALTWVPRLVYTSADALACLSPAIEAEARAAGVAPDRIHRIVHGIDLNRFHPASQEERAAARRELEVSDAALLCLFVGRLSREKGVMDILTAWNTLRPSNAVLLLAGPDSPGHTLDAGAAARAFVAAQGLGDTVAFHGPTQDTARLMQAADIFVHPSHYEAFGLSAAEALASGLPVVATRVDGFTQYLRDAENALLGAPGQAEDVARHVGRLIADPALRRRLGAAGRATAEARFDAERTFDQLARLVHGDTAPGAR